MTEIDAFAFLKGENFGDYIAYPAFCEALHQVRFLGIAACKIKQFCKKVNVTYLGFLQVGLAGIPNGLSFQDMRDLWTQADIDGNGVVDYEEFKVKEFSLVDYHIFRLCTSRVTVFTKFSMVKD